MRCCFRILIWIILLPGAVYSQGRKDIRKFGIRSSTVTSVVNEGGKEKSFISLYEVFDKEGNVIEEKETDSKGVFKKHILRKYHKSGEVSEETEKDASGNILSKYTAVINADGKKTSEQLVDGSGKIIEWTRSTYDIEGQKITEMQLDGKGVVERKHVYSYDKNGFRKERKPTTRADD